MSKLLDSTLQFLAKHFKNDASKMLIWTGVAGWGLSSLAQMASIATNKKLSPEQKSFLLPQEFMDAAVNIGTFFVFTLAAKKLTSKLFTTGKIAPQSVRKFLDNNKQLYADKVGKLDFNLDSIFEAKQTPVADAYNTYKNIGTTAATVGAGILASNVITPIVRNRTASYVQKDYINYKNSPYKNSDSMKI